ncbi:MAG: TM0996/MTH895 family glutaredoxin-like protein [Candidatus Omnitrophica bacterium]|nr:TM0996/MTH895 family glutaredoxin-like protein [Candidatus Omnitrophota bacterium]MBU4590812.1 TM0996/MTH895 family glutaredoxin-like protein [Candidatus Omnitrophota bacterium]
MKIEILGMGCAKCKELYNNAQKAIKRKGVDAELVKVEDMNKITEYGVMMTPAIVIDGEIKASGKIPSSEEIEKWIS